MFGMIALAHRTRAFVWRWGLPVALLIAWQTISTGLLPYDYKVLMPPPTWVGGALLETLTGGWEQFGMPELAAHILASLGRQAAGFGLASALAVPVGLLIGYLDPARQTLGLLVNLLRPISPIAWIPLALLILGLGNPAILFIVAYGAFFPIVTNVIAGVRGIEPTLVRAALTFGCRGPMLFREVILPGALPTVCTGLRLGMGIGWTSIVAAELVGSRSGLGFMIAYYRMTHATEKVILGMIVVGCLGWLMDRGLRRLENRLLRWRS